jgi:hypothetical protein
VGFIGGGRKEMSLAAHAKYELEKAGLFAPDSDYGGELGPCILGCVEKFASYGHSGGSAAITVAALERLLRFKTLTPITSDPSEWMEVSDNVFQNKRNSAYFSVDGGKTFYDLDDPEKKNFPKHLLGD